MPKLVLGYIYRATCLVTKKSYVGQTRVTVGHRKNCHKHDALVAGAKGLFSRAIRKYGWESFFWEVLECCPVEQLNDREIFWVEESCSLSPNGYNLQAGGQSTGWASPQMRALRSRIASRPDNIARCKSQAAAMRGLRRKDLSERNSREVLAISIPSGDATRFRSQKEAAAFAAVTQNSVSKCVRGLLSKTSGRGGFWTFERISNPESQYEE